MARPSHDSCWVAETRFSGVIAELSLPRVTARDLLPPELVLERGRGTARTYPLLTMFGEQTGSAVHLAAMKVRTGVQFHEVLFGVRCVVRRSGEPVLFVPLMYCDEPVSRWSGNALYGFNKQGARMEWLGSSFVVTRHAANRIVLRAGIDMPESCRARKPWAPDVDGLPLLGRRHDGSFASTPFEWNWDFATVELVRAIVDFQEELLPSFGPATWFVRLGRAVRVRDLRWGIGWPSPQSVGVQKHHDPSPTVMGAHA